MNHRINQKDLARLAHVCQSTVSAVLNPHGHGNTKVSAQTRELILRLAREHHYRPNMQSRQLRGKATSGLIGVLANSQLSQFFYDILLPLERELHGHGKRMIIGQLDNDLADVRATLDNFTDYNLDGVIVLHHDISSAEELFSHYSKVLPRMVFLDSPPCPAAGCFVPIDYAGGVEEAVHYLWAHGRRRIALCMSDIVYSSMRRRLSGYERGLAAHGLSVDESLLFFKKPQAPETLETVLEEAYVRLVVLGHADAIICGNDPWALAMLKSLHRHGTSVPEDVSLVGYGNTTNICLSTTPELASVDHCPELLAHELVEALFVPHYTCQAVHTHFIPRASALI